MPVARSTSTYAIFAVVSVVLAAIIALAFPSILQSTGRQFASWAFADSVRQAFPSVSDSWVNEPTEAVERHLAQLAEQETPSIRERLSQAEFTDHVAEKIQFGVMDGGCEIVSLGIALESMGIDADLDSIVRDYLDLNGSYATGYSGSPYSVGAGYPAGIVEAANEYLGELSSTYSAHDLTGSSFDDLKQIVERGYPVLVWTTMGCAEPHFTGITDHKVEWYSNEHCVVMYGFDGPSVLASDPIDGLVERDEKRFRHVYDACGNMALAIY